MSFEKSMLDPGFEDLQDVIVDFRHASYQSAISLLQRFVGILESEPLASFTAAALPAVDFQSWFARAEATGGSMVGSGELNFPPLLTERVALQLALIRHLASGRSDLMTFAHQYCYSGHNSISGHYQVFATNVLDPALRDLRKVAERRVLPPILFEAMGTLPPSGDATLDKLLADASAKFKDPAPTVRREALEKLWDAWERVKTLDDAQNKRASTERLLDATASEATFRTLLETEARALTEAGNTFLIRHFETNKIDLTRIEHGDYLFHRLYALIYLLLFARNASGNI